MTTCPRDEDLLDLAMAPRPRGAGEGEATATALSRHLAACQACSDRLAALRADLSVLRDALVDGPLPLPLPRRRDRRAWLPLAAAATAAAAAALWLMPGSPEPRATQVVSASAAGAESSDFAAEIASALFPEASRTLSDAGGDSDELVAALNGGADCDDPLGRGCDDGSLLALYD